MSDPFKIALSCALLALSAPAIAQETSSEEASPQEVPAPVPNSEDLSTGQPAREIGETYRVSQHGDWELRCITAPEGQTDPCQLYQLMKDQDGNSVAEINLFNLPGDERIAAGATIVTPLETLLTQQLRMTVDSGETRVYPFTFCSQIGCFARVGFTASEVANFKRGNQAKLVIVPAQSPDQKVELTMSLTGFTAGFEAVTKAIGDAQ